MRIFGVPLFERKALTDEQILEMLGTGVATSTGINVGVEAALQVPAVAAAVRTIAEAAASLKIGVVSIAEDGIETPDPKHPAHALLTGEANDWTTSFEMIRQLMVDALTRDQGAMAWVNWSGDNRPLEIIRYKPGTIGVEYDADGSGRPVSYRINGRPTPAREIIHLKGAFDKAPISQAREAIAVAIVMQRHAARLFGKGARPSGILKTTKSLGDEGVKKVLAGWKLAHDGSENSGKTAILWDDVQWEQMQLNSVDAQFQQLWVFIIDELARAFNIPQVMIGQMGRATWSNSAEMQRMFLLLCLEPWLQALEGALRRALFSKEDRPKFAVRIQRDDFSKVDLAVLAVAINGLISSKTINSNTGREWLGLPPRTDGEVYENPNTGASQPGAAMPVPAPAPKLKEDDNGPE